VVLAGLLQQHGAELPDGSIAAVVEQELQCWAAAAEAGTAHRVKLAQRLLRDLFPEAEQPLEHGGVLVALYHAGLPAEDGQGGLPLLERAARVLAKVGGRGSEGSFSEQRQDRQ